MKSQVQRCGKPNYIREHQHKPLELVESIVYQMNSNIGITKGKPMMQQSKKDNPLKPLICHKLLS
jgi:hypothetical protein